MGERWKCRPQGERHMRKVAILMTCLLMGTCAAEIAKTEPAAKEVPPKYRAQIVSQMSQALDLSQIHDAGITPLVVRFVSLMSGTREVVCVITLKGASSLFTYKVYQETIFTFKDGQAERGSTNMLKGTGSVSRTKLDVSGPCRGLTTSPFPEIVRGKPPS